MCHLKPFMALWKSRCTFQEQMAWVYLPACFSYPQLSMWEKACVASYMPLSVAPVIRMVREYEDLPFEKEPKDPGRIQLEKDLSGSDCFVKYLESLLTKKRRVTGPFIDEQPQWRGVRKQ